MTKMKLERQDSKSNGIKLSEYENYVAVDWSKSNMAIARLTRSRVQPKVLERPADIRELKTYLKGLKGKTIVTVEETMVAHWLYLELHDVVDKILICDPYLPAGRQAGTSCYRTGRRWTRSMLESCASY